MRLFDNDYPLLDLSRLYLPSFGETWVVVRDFAVAEVFTLVGGFLWLILLAVPLSGIDRRDGMTGLTYVLYMSAGGTALVFAVARQAAGATPEPVHAAAIAGFAAVAAVRWLAHRQPPSFIVVPVKGARGAPPAAQKNDRSGATP